MFVLKRDLKKLNYSNSDSLVNPLVENEEINESNSTYENKAFSENISSVYDENSSKLSDIIKVN